MSPTDPHWASLTQNDPPPPTHNNPTDPTEAHWLSISSTEPHRASLILAEPHWAPLSHNDTYWSIRTPSYPQHSPFDTISPSVIQYYPCLPEMISNQNSSLEDKHKTLYEKEIIWDIYSKHMFDIFDKGITDATGSNDFHTKLLLLQPHYETVSP